MRSSLYIDHLLAVLREVRRVLRPDGTLWLNLGDCAMRPAAAKRRKPAAAGKADRWEKYGPRGYQGIGEAGFQPNRMPSSAGPFRAAGSVPRASSDVDTLFDDWKRTQPLSGGREESIGDCGRDGRCAGLTDAARLLGAFNDRHGNLRHLCQMQHRIGIKIRLLDPPALERDLAVERRGETVDDAALHLRNDRAGIDRYAAIDGAVHTMNAQTFVFDRDLLHLGDDRPEGLVHGDAAEMAGGGWLGPVGHRGHPLQDRPVRWLIGQQTAAEQIGVLTCRMCQLVDEAFDVEAGNAVADRAPKSDRDSDVLQYIYNAAVRWSVFILGAFANCNPVPTYGRKNGAPVI